MSNSGKQLEELVAFVERNLVPEGFTVTNNHKVFDESGTQLAEFDVVVEGRVGTGNVRWLIECRNRPSGGAAPGAWIEQLDGRRRNHGFNKVTAVSTTGFAAAAQEAGRKLDVELREVKAFSPEEFRHWLQARVFQQVERVALLEHATLILADSDDAIRTAALQEVLSAPPRPDFLRAKSSGKYFKPGDAFADALSNAGVFDSLEANAEVKQITLEAIYTNPEDSFVVETSQGDVPIGHITFRGGAMLKVTEIPILGHAAYMTHGGPEIFAQTAGVKSTLPTGHTFELSLTRMGENGETYISVQVTPPTDA